MSATGPILLPVPVRDDGMHGPHCFPLILSALIFSAWKINSRDYGVNSIISNVIESKRKVASVESHERCCKIVYVNCTMAGDSEVAPSIGRLSVSV